MHIFNYLILEIFLEYDEVEEYVVMIDTLKNYLGDFILRNEKVDAYVNTAIRVFDKHLNKTIYSQDIDAELYVLLEIAKLHRC